MLDFILSLFFGITVTGPRADEVYAAYWQLPKTGIVTQVKIVERKDWGHGENTIGVYYISAKRIEMPTDLDKETFRAVFGHEYGHAFYFQRFNTKAWVDWKTWWDAHIPLMPRWYAETSSQEGWAECFAVRFLGTQSRLFDKKDISLELVKEIDRMISDKAYLSPKEETYAEERVIYLKAPPLKREMGRGYNGYLLSLVRGITSL